MSIAAENKRIMQAIYAALAEGNGRPFIDAMADDFTWIMEGTTAWSGTFAGKARVRDAVLRPLFAQFATLYVNRAERFIAEGDSVVILCRGEVGTSTGKSYNNSYCLVVRLRDGKMIELREFLDTALVDAVLEPPRAAA